MLFGAETYLDTEPSNSWGLLITLAISCWHFFPSFCILKFLFQYFKHQKGQEVQTLLM